jgi:hypothetical protein
MNERPTPETDAAQLEVLSNVSIHVCDEAGEMADFARRLERKRDEITERWERAANAYMIEQGKREAAERQRDELMEALDDLINSLQPDEREGEFGRGTTPRKRAAAVLASVKGGTP